MLLGTVEAATSIWRNNLALSARAEDAHSLPQSDSRPRETLPHSAQGGRTMLTAALFVRVKRGDALHVPQQENRSTEEGGMCRFPAAAGAHAFTLTPFQNPITTIKDLFVRKSTRTKNGRGNSNIILEVGKQMSEW